MTTDVVVAVADTPFRELVAMMAEHEVSADGNSLTLKASFKTFLESKLAGGVPNPETFPAERIAEVAAKVVRERRTVALQYGPTEGLAETKDCIAEVMRAEIVIIRPLI